MHDLVAYYPLAKRPFGRLVSFPYLETFPVGLILFLFNMHFFNSGLPFEITIFCKVEFGLRHGYGLIKLS